MFYLYQNEAGEVHSYTRKRARKGTIFLGGFTKEALQELIGPVVPKEDESEFADDVRELHRLQEEIRRSGPCEDDCEVAAEFLEITPEEHDQKLQGVTKDFIQWSL